MSSKLLLVFVLFFLFQLFIGVTCDDKLEIDPLVDTNNKSIPYGDNFVSLALDGDLLGIREQIQSGAVVDVQNKRGWTALMGSVVNGHEEITSEVILLLL
jgi:ankyrin repeat protein